MLNFWGKVDFCEGYWGNFWVYEVGLLWIFFFGSLVFELLILNMKVIVLLIINGWCKLNDWYLWVVGMVMIGDGNDWVDLEFLD